MTGSWRTCAAVAAAALLCGIGGAVAGPMPLQTEPGSGRSGIVAVQYYGYGYRGPYGFYRPYGGYRPYAFGPRGYGPGPRYYNNHFGPGAAKERYVTRRNLCRNRPEQC